MPSTRRRALAACAAATLALVACGDDDTETPDPGVENQEEVDAGDGPTTEVPSGGGAGTTGGNTDQGNVEPDSPDDTTQDTAYGDMG
ncbi:MAG TPA: hypothetical protein VJ804_07895 [Acidimicrobiales bacterium]|nr:hypothetical protein [Acidimicrobiales bacterium]